MWKTFVQNIQKLFHMWKTFVQNIQKVFHIRAVFHIKNVELWKTSLFFSTYYKKFSTYEELFHIRGVDMWKTSSTFPHTTKSFPHINDMWKTIKRNKKVFLAL